MSTLSLARFWYDNLWVNGTFVKACLTSLIAVEMLIVEDKRESQCSFRIPMSRVTVSGGAIIQAAKVHKSWIILQAQR